jgi:hypothetical protein
MTDYKATPKQWEQVLSWSEDRDVSVSCDAASILELRARVEALEAAAQMSTFDSSQIVNYRLLERVEDDLMESIKDQSSMARAAIREVAAWMHDNNVGYNAVEWLKLELK